MNRLLNERLFVIASLALLLEISGPVACRNRSTLSGNHPAIDLESSSFTQGTFARQFTCDGAGRSPALAWNSAPPGTRSFAIIVIDRDAPFGAFAHWLLYDLAPDKRGLLEGLPAQPQLPDGSRQGRNDFGNIGYGGPCPPGKSPHRYVFTLYALDSIPDVPPGATEKQVMRAIRGHVLAQGEMVERYQR